MLLLIPWSFCLSRFSDNICCWSLLFLQQNKQEKRESDRITRQESNDEGDVDEKYDDERDEGLREERKRKGIKSIIINIPLLSSLPSPPKTGKKSIRFTSCLFYSCPADFPWLITIDDGHHYCSFPIFPVNHLSSLKTIRDPFFFWSGRKTSTTRPKKKSKKRHLSLTLDVVSDSLTRFIQIQHNSVGSKISMP